MGACRAVYHARRGGAAGSMARCPSRFDGQGRIAARMSLADVGPHGLLDDIVAILLTDEVGPRQVPAGPDHAGDEVPVTVPIDAGVALPRAVAIFIEQVSGKVDSSRPDRRVCIDAVALAGSESVAVGVDLRCRKMAVAVIVETVADLRGTRVDRRI